MHLVSLHIHPVKSLRGCAVDTASVDSLGLIGDRRFLVVDETGRFLTQRALPRMALVATALSVDTLTLSAESHGSVAIARYSSASGSEKSRTLTVTIWRDVVQTDDCGEAPAEWLSGFLGVKCRLVRIGDAYARPVNKPGKARGGDAVMFADAYPVLVISEASLAELNQRLAARGEPPVPMNRFRPNLVVSGCAPFAEDTWTRFRIGDVAFRAGGPCSRCVITTTDQTTAERGPEPLRTLATYRRDKDDPTGVNFGQNLFLETQTGTLRVGDRVEIVESR